MAGVNFEKLRKNSTPDQGRQLTTKTSAVSGTARQANRLAPSVDMDPLNPEDGIETARVLFRAATNNILAIGELCLNMKERFPDFKHQIVPKMEEFFSYARLYDVMALARAVRLGKLRDYEVPTTIRSGTLLLRLEDDTIRKLRDYGYDFANSKPRNLKETLEELGIEDKSLKPQKEQGGVEILPPKAKRDPFAELASVLTKVSKSGGIEAMSKRDVDRLHETVQKNPALKSFLAELISK
ncbi:hypothetical protein [Acetobacter persici]|uniref:Uncharacterized protein n=1 Tax=Acetobacter persici TaxID=1076596 RepID=A0A1U9LIW9_9PROT|nr:hypothetical protein [Acetobacter persici]AQT06404.1 hypothetical protein A0U91_15430 [Acetobacter persici]